MKLMSGFLALMFLMYCIVSFIYIPPDQDSPKPTVEHTAKGMIYLGITIYLIYLIAVV